MAIVVSGVSLKRLVGSNRANMLRNLLVGEEFLGLQWQCGTVGVAEEATGSRTTEKPVLRVKEEGRRRLLKSP